MIVESTGLSRRHVALARTIATGGKALLLAGMVLVGPVLAMEPGDRFVGPIYGGSIAFGFFALAASYAVSLTQTWAPGRVLLRREALVLRGRAIPRARIASAFVVFRRIANVAAPTVEIELGTGDVVSVRTSNAVEAAELVTALGFGPGGRRVRVDLARATRRLLHPLLGGAALVFGLVAGSIAALSFAGTSPARASAFGGVLYAALAVSAGALYALLKRLSAAPVVVVGSDGVVVERPLRKTPFSRAELARSGSVVPTVGFVHDRDREDAVARMIADRFGAGASRPTRAAAFGRSGRELAAWRAHLRSTLDAGYREAGASVDDAVAVLASAGATDDERIGAALALRIAGEPLERIRVSAQGAIGARLRVALEAIADDDDVRIQKALEAER